MNEKVVNAALLGLGTVGTGVYKVIKSQEQEMTAKLGCQVKITKILVRNLEKASGKVDDPSVLTTDWADIEGDPSIDIVIELIGGIERARTVYPCSTESRQERCNCKQGSDRSPRKRDPGNCQGSAEGFSV